MKHGSLFSGIGGFDLAAHWMGWNNVFQVEKDKWCNKILAKNFPQTQRHNDIKNFTGYEYTNRIDVISGGFPCQPFSVAGKRKGKNDDRYLWQEMLRVIATIKPAYVVGENVTGIIGLALDTVLSDLEAHNYTTETFIIPACGKNAWHKRDRVWIVAYANMCANGWGKKQNTKTDRIQEINRQKICTGVVSGTSEIFSNTKGERTGRLQNESRTEGAQCSNELFGKLCGVLPDTSCYRCKEQRQQSQYEQKYFTSRCSSWWEVEPGVGRVVNGLPHRLDRLRGLGNAIVPQIAFEIFNAIETLHNTIH